MTTTRGRVQAHRSGWLRVALASAVLYTVVLSVLVAVAVGGGLPIWACALIGVTVLVLLFVPIRGRLVLIEWPEVVGAFWRRRKRDLIETLPAPSDIKVISGEAGVRWDGFTLVAAIEVTPQDAEPTCEVDGRAVTDSVLPLKLVASLMTQYGLHLDIDVVISARHVPAGSAYRVVYAETVGSRALPGQRRTWLVLRLNTLDNLDAVFKRGPSRVAAPKALATAAARAVQRLKQEQIRAHTLTPEELEGVSELLLAPVSAAASQEHWGSVQSGANYISTYVGDPAALSPAQLDQWWSWRTEDSVVMLRMCHGPHKGEVLVGPVVRYVTTGKAARPLAEAKLSLPTGLQRLMLTAALPGGDRSLDVALPAADLAALDEDFAVPMGPAGQVLGQLDDGTMITVPLWDQGAEPARRRVEARVSTELAQQLILRAVVTGATVAIHTDARERWTTLLAAIGDSDRLFFATSGAFACDIAVFDGRPVSTVAARTVLRLLDATTPAALGVELTLVQVSEHHLELTVRSGAPQKIRIIRSREEDRYLGIGAPAAAARRAPVAAPTLSRRSRPPAEQGRAVAQAPRRAPRVVTPERAEFHPEPPRPQSEPPRPQTEPPGRQRVPASNGHVPVSGPGPVNSDGRPPLSGDAASGGGVSGGGRRRLDGPQRIPRGAQPSAPTPPEVRRPRRNFNLPDQPQLDPRNGAEDPDPQPGEGYGGPAQRPERHWGPPSDGGRHHR